MRKKLISILTLTFLLAMGTAVFTSCDKSNNGSGGEGNYIERPEMLPEVYSVKIVYNEKPVEGIINIDISEKMLEVSADVQKNETSKDVAVFASSKTEVATIDQSGKITLFGVGETVISAKAGDKVHEIVLVVKNELNAETYSINVNNGTVDKKNARYGDIVYLTPEIPKHKDFVKWNFDVEGVIVNGNSFVMPNKNVTVTAEFKDTLYKLNVIGAEIVNDPSVENTENAAIGVEDMTTYNLPFDKEVKLKAVKAPEGMMFVGWDFGGKNNRDGEMGIDEFSFTMPDEELAVWAVFSDVKKTVLGENANSAKFQPLNKEGAARIKNGKINNTGDAIPELDGCSGYRFSFKEDAIRNNDEENIEDWSSIDTVKNGTTVIKMILVNHNSKADVTVECFASNCGNLAKSGNVTVKAGTTKIHYFSVGIGFQSSWWGFNVRNIERNGGERDNILLDAVFAQAPMYPDGDKSLNVTGVAEYVNIEGNQLIYDGSWNGGVTAINNANGTITLSDVGGHKTLDYASKSYKISNMPKANENGKNTVYVRGINNYSGDDEQYSFKVMVSKSINPADAVGESELLVLNKKGQIELGKIEFDRDPDYTGDYYLIIYRPIPSENNWFSHGHCITVQAAFNNVLGYTEEEVK